ncbi:MAG TPA: methylated-DNA--[protein]-cysteine S-methyltransferase [Candidatus Acidoferrum sp.]|nr:methylated-DNA--[protein]-cysteine S-methyltransferase [Candidatus Acidoferrum sp.]
MTVHGFALFDTAIGRCGIAWSGQGVAGLQLPEARPDATRARVLERFPDAREVAPPPHVERALDGIAALLRGETCDLSSVPLDMERVPAFHRRVYDVAREIPPGQTLSYGDIAARLGMPGSARAVGQALGRNPFAIVVPCHRVLAAGGKVGGFSASGGIATKLRLLQIEGRRNGSGPEGDRALRFDPAAALEHLRASDPGLARLFDAVGRFRMQLDAAPSTFVALAEAIVYQQLTGRAAATIFARVCALFPRPHEGPTAEQVVRASDRKLRAAGLSGSKVLSLKDLAQKTRAGEIPSLAELRSMEDEAIVERLTRVRGIGRWTVEMLLIFRLGRPDVLPVDDLGIRKGFAIAFRKRDLPGPRELEKRGERWRPYRTVASWYLWRALEPATR